MKLEIVSHCWHYSRLLRYQLSSLFLHTPGAGVEVLMTVVTAPEDRETAAVLGTFLALMPPAGVTLRPWPMPRGRLPIREIGRDEVALTTDADWVWFADCDYLFRAGSLGALAAAAAKSDSALLYPRYCWVSRTPELGDAAIERSSDAVGLLDVDPSDFEPVRNSRAIGGIQVARGDVVRRLGYCNGSRRPHGPAPHWRRAFSDVRFRHSLGTRGTPRQGAQRVPPSSFRKGAR